MRAIAVAIVMLQVAAPPARADAVETAARAHFDRGVGAYNAGDYALARREFAAASQLAPAAPNPYRWLALAEVQLGDCKNAVGHIDAFLSRVPAEDERRPELVRLRELCERTGVLRVESTPPNAALRIDGAVVGTTPYRALSMRAGAHTLVAEKAGFAAQSQSIVVTAGGELDVRFALKARASPITRRWWFWAAIGGAVATTAVVIAVARDERDPEILPPIVCTPTGCAP